MSKRLVKTAKQQFEERLCSMKKYGSYSPDAGDVFHGCEDYDGKLVILRESEGNYVELKYAQSYADLVESEDFLKAMTERALEVGISVKKLFDWYASADRDFDAFDWEDIWRVDLEETSVEFEDIYEEDEIEEARKIAYEEVKLKGMTLGFDDGNSEAFSSDVEGKWEIIYIWGATAPSLYRFSMAKKDLFKSKDFQSKMLQYTFKHRGKEESVELLEWMEDTNNVTPFDLYDIVMAVNENYIHAEVEEYENRLKSKHTMKQDFSKELDELRKKMIAHIEQLCEQGMTINVEVLCQNPFLLWEDKCYTHTDGVKDCWIMKDKKDEWGFFYTYNEEGQYNSNLHHFSLETLWHIIEALQ